MKQEEKETISSKLQFGVFYIYGFLMIAIGFILTPSLEKVLEGIKIIITHPSRIDFDSFYWTGNLGAPFVQAGLCFLIVLVVYNITKTKLQGGQIAALFMVFGFAFYGKNILSMWFPILGVFLHGIWKKKKASQVTALAFFMSCISPMFTTYAFGVDKLNPGSTKAIVIGASLAIITGFFASQVADFFPKYHDGLLLYNAGLAAGFAIMVVYSFLKAIGLGLEAPDYGDAYISGQNGTLTIILAILFGYLILAGIILKGWPQFKKLFWHDSHGENHVEEFGFSANLIQMGILGLLAVGYVLLIRGQLSAPVFASIGAVVGFSTNGSTARTHLPALIGVALGAFLTGGLNGIVLGGTTFLAGGLAKLASRSMILSALFTCGIAPITGRYGVLAGLLTGFVHSFVVSNIAPLHGWISLYNNGYCLGLVVIFLFPIYSHFSKQKQENKAL